MYTHTHIHTYRNGDTALHLAVVRNSAECVQALLDPESKARAAPTHAHTNTHTHARTHTRTNAHILFKSWMQSEIRDTGPAAHTRTHSRAHANTVARAHT
jgi:ankyrin repeat protein